MTNYKPLEIRIIVLVFYIITLCCLCPCCCDLVNSQWMESGMSGPGGAPARPPVPTAPCRGPESAAVPRTAALSAGESGWRLSTASWGTVLVWEHIILIEWGKWGSIKLYLHFVPRGCYIVIMVESFIQAVELESILWNFFYSPLMVGDCSGWVSSGPDWNGPNLSRVQQWFVRK